MLRIVSDGSIDMPADWEEQFKIHILPLKIQLGDQLYLQGRDVTARNFYNLVREKMQPPKTSLPSPAEMIHFYRQLAGKDDQVLSIHVGSRLSGTFAVAQQAAKELAGELAVVPFDSGAGSAAIGFMCREARMLAQRGWSLDSIVDRLAAVRNKLTVVFTVENLEFVRLSGRIGTIQSAVASILKINPIIQLRDGLLYMTQRVRTRHTAIDKICEEVRERVGSSKVHLAIVHAACPDTAQILVEKIRKLIPLHGDIVITELSIPVAAHLGPGTVGIVAYPILEGGM